MYNRIMRVKRFLICFFLGAAVFGTAIPAPAKIWRLSAEALLQLNRLPPGALTRMADGADLDQDGRPERLVLHGETLEIFSGGSPVWRSPSGWQVRAAGVADLNRDGVPEAVLLVWRRFQPWPIDRVLPFGGRIAAYQDAQGQSCHLILIGKKQGAYRELWAGSALAQPLADFAAADLDGDGRQELVALESRYTDPAGAPARELSVWEWNGFGFSLQARVQGAYRELKIYQSADGQSLILTRSEGETR